MTRDQNMADLNGTTQASPPAFSFFPPGYFVFTEKQLNDTRFAVYVILMPITALFGIGGNISCFIILKRKVMRTTQNLLLLALSVADTMHLLSTLFHCFNHMVTYFHKVAADNFANAAYPYFGAYFYHLWGRISALLTVGITVERLIAVMLPLKVKVIWTKKVAIVCICLCYLFPALLMIPQIFEYEPTDVRIHNTTDVKVILMLSELGKNRVLFTNLYNSVMTLLRYIPIFIVCLANVVIISGLWHHAKQRKNLENDAVTRMSSKEIKITRTLLFVSMLFFVCSVPGTTIFLIQNVDPEYNFPFFRNNAYTFALIISLWFEVFNSSFNFVIYVATNNKFRDLYKEMCPCFKKKFTSENNIYMDSSQKPVTISSAVTEESEMSNYSPDS